MAAPLYECLNAITTAIGNQGLGRKAGDAAPDCPRQDQQHTGMDDNRANFANQAFTGVEFIVLSEGSVALAFETGFEGIEIASDNLV